MPPALQELLAAARSIDVEPLRRHLADPEVVALRSPKGKTLLHVAAEAGRAETVRVLVAAGVSVDARTDEGETPLLLAAAEGRRSAVFWAEAMDGIEGTFDEWRFRPKFTPAAGDALLELVRRRGVPVPPEVKATDDLPDDVRSPALSALLDLLVDREQLRCELAAAGIDAAAVDPELADFAAGFPHYRETVAALLDLGADVNALDAGGEAPLGAAVAHAGLALIELLLARGADPNLRGQPEMGCSETPIETAFSYYRTDFARLLWRHGARVNFAENCPLHHAAANGAVQLLRWLLEIGGDIEQRNDWGDTPLLCAAIGHDNVVMELCARGADLRATNLKQHTAQHIAACSPKCLGPLLERMGPVTSFDADGLTPLHKAARGAADESIRLLVAAGVDVNARDAAGNTPLHAIFQGDEFRPDIEFPAVEALLACGADRTLRDAAGRTAFERAQEYSYPREYLEALDPDRGQPFTRR